MTTKNPVHLYVFYHDDVDAKIRPSVPRAYLKDCIIELQKVTGREFIIDYRHSIPGVTDIAYKGDGGRAIRDWISVSSRYAAQNNLAADGTERLLLVTKHAINEELLGISVVNGSSLIASLTSYQTIPHELGHTMGATHEDAQLQHNAFGIPCATYMHEEVSDLRANCYQYSLKNRQNIAEYFAGRP
ncbi:MAG TPA: hypothetical protein VN798_00890 [Pseudomonas sp.]|nr:hypothetical protein [Pseudomonas sp.]